MIEIKEPLPHISVCTDQEPFFHFMNTVRRQFLLSFFLIALSGCYDQSYQEGKNLRTQSAANQKDGYPIIIGIPWKKTQTDQFVNGVKLAVKEINEKGGVLNSPLQLVINEGENAYTDPNLSVGQKQNAILNIASSFAANSNLIAVIGHSSSTIATISSIIYQNSGILFFATAARFSKVTGHNFEYLFRTISTNSDTGEHLADFAAQKGYKNIAVLHARDDSAQELADVFTTHSMNEYGTNIVYRHSFFDSTVDIISLIIDLKNIQKLDAIFIAASSQVAADIYRESRLMGIKLPFIGSESFDSKVFLEQVEHWEQGKDVEKTSIPTVFNATAANSHLFVQRFKEEYGENSQPDYLAAIGYDTINLFAHGIQRAQSRIPIEVAVSLRYMEGCRGVAGRYEFKPNGDMKPKTLYFKHFDKDHYVYERTENTEWNLDNEASLDVCNDIDRDHDTIPNNMDACPNSTKEQVAEGIVLEGLKKGCPINEDSD